MRRLIKSFRYAFSGLGYAFSTQLNFRIHSIIFLLVCAAGWYYALSRTEWFVVILVSGLVILTELLNTAIEVLVDLASPGYHEKAKIIKDVAAGAVVIACVVAGLTGLIIFVPKIISA